MRKRKTKFSRLYGKKQVLYHHEKTTIGLGCHDQLYLFGMLHKEEIKSSRIAKRI